MFSSKKFLSAFTAVLTACAVVASAAPAQNALFKGGDRWTAVGDSITHGGAYCASIYLYYATRFPDLNLDVSNAGNSGDDARGTLSRYDWDIQPNKPTVATVMLGMNDVRRELYGPLPVTSEMRGQRTYILEGYSSFMTKLVKKLQADGTRVVLITPSIYDETAENPKTAVLTGVNGALAQCGKIGAKLAQDTGSKVIDFNSPMAEINARMQAKDPTASLIRSDRVHPGPVGHFVMAYLFLKGQDAPAIVSSVSIDAAGTKVLKAENASVEKLQGGKGSVSFTVKEKALPFPIDKEQEPALEWIPFNDDLNREILKVSGLAAGDYTLSIDGKAIRSFKAEELEKGVNLALEKNTPQAEQAAGVLALMKDWHKQMGELRAIASFEFWNLGSEVHPFTVDAVRERLEADMAAIAEQIKDQPKEKYKVDNYARYLKNKPLEAENKAKLGEIAGKIRAAAKPQPHAYKLELVKP